LDDFKPRASDGVQGYIWNMAQYITEEPDNLLWAHESKFTVKSAY